jgi:hypothetical protein
LNVFENIGSSVNEINNNMITMHAEYSCIRHNYETDIKYTLLVSIRSTLGIISCSYRHAEVESEAMLIFP